MSQNQTASMIPLSHKSTKLIAVIGDEDTVTGFLLSGIGDASGSSQSSRSQTREQTTDKKTDKVFSSTNQSNFFIVTNDTEVSAIEECFKSFVERKDIGIVLICQYIAEQIRESVDSYSSLHSIPTVLEIPSKEHPYDPEKDSMLKKAKVTTTTKSTTSPPFRS